MKYNKCEATVIIAKCQKTKKPYGIRLERIDDNDWCATWAFKIDEEKIKKEHYEENIITGRGILVDKKFPGCPYCKATNWFKCSCDKLTCFENGQKSITCAWCNTKCDSFYYPESFDYKGNSM